MKLSKNQRKIWTVLVIVAGLALVLTSLLPALTAIFGR